MFKAIGVLQGLERAARDRGYTEDEIRKHLKSKEEKKRLRARAAKYMDAQGFGQTEAGYCALGEAEIARKSEIGALLRTSR
jgi:predicted transcriptional regulator